MESLLAKTKSFVIEHKWWLLILVLAASLRLYRLPEMAAYDSDQEFVSDFVYQVVNEYPIRLVGQGMSIKGLFMGPWYFYYLVPFYGLTNWQPLGGYIGSVILGLITISLYYWVGTRIFSRQVGILAAFLRAITFYAINTDWMMTPAHGSDLLIILFWYLLYQLWQKKWWALPSLALVAGLFTSFHPVHVPLWLVSVFLIWKWKIKPNWQISLVSLFLFVLPSLPLMLFEYWRKGAMIKTVLALFGHGSGGFNLIQIWVKTNIVIDFFEEFLASPANWFWWGLCLCGGFLLLLFQAHIRPSATHSKFHRPALMATFGVVILYYAFFPSNVPEYYLGSLRALLYLYVPAVMIFLGRKFKFGYFVVGAILTNIILTNAQILIHRWQHPELLSTYYHKNKIVDQVLEQVGNNEFALSLITDPGAGFGYESLFKLKHHPSVGRGPVYTIIVPKKLFPDSEYEFTSGAIGLTYPDIN